MLVCGLLLLASLRPVHAQSPEAAGKSDGLKPDLIEVVVPAADPAQGIQAARTVMVPQARAASIPEANQAEEEPPAAAMAQPRHAAKVRGLLPYAGDRHYFGLESIQPRGAFAVTLVVEPAEALAQGDGVNFMVLTEAGLAAFLAGAAPEDVMVAGGSPRLFDQVGNRLTALAPGSRSSGYTVIVYSNTPRPVTYTLQVQGAVLRDDAGQTLATVVVGEPQHRLESSQPTGPAPGGTAGGIMPQQLAEMMELGNGEFPFVMEAAPDSTGQAPRPATVLLPKDAVRARRISAQLSPASGRHYYELAAEEGGQDVTLSLALPESGDRAEAALDSINFWVMTQDGVRHLVRGGLAQELNLATGRFVEGAEATYEARLRIAPHVVYTVVVYNESDRQIDYTLRVQGGVLIDPYGQSREAQAAALEILTLNQDRQQR